jgi:hypothetical protein
MEFFAKKCPLELRLQRSKKYDELHKLCYDNCRRRLWKRYLKIIAA